MPNATPTRSSLWLTAPWRLSDFAPGEGVAAGAHAPTLDDSGWLPVDVPGDVHRTLIAAGRIADPFYDRKETDCAWIEGREWWYRLTFDGPDQAPHPGDRLRLVFHGLDTFATIWLNGEVIGQHENMFRPAVFDITDGLIPAAPNTLALRFDPPLDHVRALTEQFGEFQSWGPHTESRLLMRKAQFGYGWDWGPRLPTVGIWRPVELRYERLTVLDGVQFSTVTIDREAGRAVVRVRVEADRFATDRPLEADIRLTPPDGRPALTARVTLDGETAHVSGSAYLTVEQPALWWTHDLGDPTLHTLTVTLSEYGQPLDIDQQHVGIRTIALDQSPDPDEPGTRFFRFVLNGVPIFARGADWIPADSFVGAIAPEHYADLLTAARDANMTMLRIWGGGIYEHDVFYDTCDRLGILVWQDFMFACAAYPEHIPAFNAEVAAEARYQVRRLRSHPCMALWCGNNENQWIHDVEHWSENGARVPGALFYDETLPRAVAEHDGSVPYWPGSPYGGSDHNSMEDGDRHNWDVWHGGSVRRFGEEPQHRQGPEAVSYRRYADDRGRFISEFGMHAAPVFETLRRNIPADQLTHHSPAMDHHNKDNPKNKGDNLMLTVTGLPDTLEDYIDFSMIAQAEGLKFGIEHFRRRKPHCAGTLFWQLNDCWPVLSWSVIDYYGFGKAGYFYARRVYAPVLASFKPLDDGGVELWITNDTLETISDTVSVTLRSFGGETFWQEAHPLSVEPNSSAAVLRWGADAIAAGPDRYLSVRAENDSFAPNRHFFAAIKDLQRDPVTPHMAITQIDAQTLRVDLRAAAYAYFVHLVVPHEATRFSDNYFDLEPGERRTITITNSAVPLSPDGVTVYAR